MNFSKTYRRMNEPVGPSPDLIRKTLSHPDRHRLPLRRLAAAAAVAAVLLATPALAVRSETGYAVLYRIAPAVAQFFQPVQEACTDSGITSGRPRGGRHCPGVHRPLRRSRGRHHRPV